MQHRAETSDTISVSEYLDQLNISLKAERARIVGEVSGVQEYPGRSYLYYSIKDGVDGSTVKCFMWKRDYHLSGITLAEGMQVVITAYPNIYKPNGGLSLQVEAVELVGEGALKIAYYALKKKLEDEGLFDDSRKRKVPRYPQRIGVITSKSGAVINDFLTNIGKFGFDISFVDSKVEGQDAIKDLLRALDTLHGKDIDVLVIMRGGGSLESFLAFNNEVLVRKVAAFHVPVLTGIGHDKDVSLVSLVSDKNVSTPTAVANLLNSTWNEALSEVRLAESHIFSSFERALQNKQYMIENSGVAIEHRFAAIFETFRRAEATLVSSVRRIESRIEHIGEMVGRDVREISRNFDIFTGRLSDILSQSSRDIFRSGESLTARIEEKLGHYEKTLELRNPERQLAYGYSIAMANGKVVRNVSDAPAGTPLDVIVRDGTIHTQIQ